ncbi:MAG: SMP-30/gluconolactonase/LRE family protein [Planctomycetota bacterium]
MPSIVDECRDDGDLGTAAAADLIAPGAEVEKLAGGFAFTEGPACDGQGNLYFTVIPNEKILKWSVDGSLSTFRENSGRANGLYFDRQGHLVVCEGTEGPDTYHPEMDPFAPMDPRLGLLQPVDPLSYRDTRHSAEIGFREYRIP